MAASLTRFLVAADDSTFTLTQIKKTMATTTEIVGTETDVVPSVNPAQAWEWILGDQAQLVDVRTYEEYTFVGHVPGSLNIPWAEGHPLVRNPRFLDDLEALIVKGKPVLFLCRSGKRSEQAALSVIQRGLTNIFNVLEGFEGDLNDQQQRGTTNGWKARGLPWKQD
jgi:rhodanese-related sulfurtransferase